MEGQFIRVVEMGKEFSPIWRELETDLGVPFRVAGDGENAGSIRDASLLLLSAGGVEIKALEWLERESRQHATDVFAVGSDAGHRIAAQLVRAGAKDYFALPGDVEILRNSLATEIRRRSDEIRRAGREGRKENPFATIVGDSPALRAVLARAERILRHGDATALLVGETGTGKELLAQAIHKGGPRRNAPFVAINCSALPAHLVESELFGHERGAFTDAHASKPGLFEVADGGTLFFDEVGTLPVDLQAKLLRALEERKIRRVGGTRTRDVNIRILAATNSDLKEAIAAGTFREDLYYRIGVITLALPPLRDRGDDVIAIARALLAKLAAQHGVPAPHLSAAVRSALHGHNWPGNIRELKNALERSLLLSPPGELDPAELMIFTNPEGSEESPIPFPARLDAITTAAARSMVELCRGNRSEAARRLDISRKRLRRLLGPDLSSSTVTRGESHG